MTGITAHEELTQRQSKTAQRVLRVHAMVIGLYHVQPSFSRKPKRHRLSVYWCLLIFDEYDAKSFNPQPTARKWPFCTHIVLSIATIRNRLDLSSIDLKSITAEKVICHDCLDSITSTSSNSHRVRVPFH
jgi:hypothetical protein